MKDAEPLLHLRQDPEMMRYIGDGHIQDEVESESWLRWTVDLWKVDGYSLFAADLKPDNRFVGWVGITKPYWFPEMMPTPEIGWFIERALWGQGLASEGAEAALGFAFETLGIERVIGIYNGQNTASGRVMEKIGMTFWQEVPHPRLEFPLRIYEVSR
jgi:RimJ/RimL family protein N-acetyltransferase